MEGTHLPRHLPTQLGTLGRFLQVPSKVEIRPYPSSVTVPEAHHLYAAPIPCLVSST